MKQGKTIQELAAELTRQQNTKRDFLAPGRSLKLNTGNDSKSSMLFLEDLHEGFPVNDMAHDQIATRMDIPRQYYKRMQAEMPKLLDENVNSWFGKDKRNHMIRTLDGSVRAALSEKYRPLDSYDLLEAVLPELMSQDVRVESCEVTPARLYLKVVTEKVQFEIKKGDIVQAGMVISNSEVGLGMLKIEPLLYRLVCTNGMIANDAAMRKYHVGRVTGDIDSAVEYYRDETRMLNDKAFWMKVRDIVAGSFKQIEFDKLAGRMVSATKHIITAEPIKTVEVTQKRFGLSESEKNGILQQLLMSNDLSRFGLVNAITRHSQDVEDYDRATELERLGGTVLELPRSDWETLAVN